MLLASEVSFSVGGGEIISKKKKKGGNSAFLAISPSNSSAFLQRGCICGPSPAALLADPILLAP